MRRRETAKRSSRVAALLLTATTGCNADLFHATSWTSFCDEHKSDPSCRSAQGGGGVGGAGAAGGSASSSGGAAGMSSSSGTCTPTGTEDCSTPADDDCNGVVNDGCPPTGYSLVEEPGTGAYTYFDDVHNLNTTGSATDNTQHAAFAAGQLTDGMKGADAFGADLGQGAAYEWVGWSIGDVHVVFDFGVARDFSALTIGMNNAQNASGVSEPGEVDIAFGSDGMQFGTAAVYRLDNGTLTQIPIGARGDAHLSVPSTRARYVQITFVPADTWVFVDEVSFE